MTLPRLLNEGTREERRLLRSARSDGPSNRLREQVLLSVSVGTLIAMESATSHAALGSSAPHGIVSTTAATGTLASTGIAVLVKWVGIAGVALLAGTSAGFVAGTTWADSARSATATHHGESTLLAPNAAQLPRASPVEAPPSIEPIAQATATLPLPPPRVPVAAPRSQHDAPPTDFGVADEVRLIDDARIALRSGDAAQCLRLLAERRHRFANGVLTPEAALLQIEALSLSGQREAARREGLRFLSQYPTGPLSGRVRGLLGRQADEALAATELGTEAM
jgi:hypothetical protein